MYGLIDIGGKEVAMEANALSPYVYRQLFHEDFLTETQKEPPAPDLFQKMGFVMAKQAEHLGTAELMKLTIDSFYEWLMQFDALDIIFATDKISELYLAQNKQLSVPKNKGV